MFTWSVFNCVAVASQKPGFPRVLWIIPLVVVPVSSFGACIAFWRERSDRIRLYTLKWLSAFIPAVAAPIVLSEGRIGLIGYLGVNVASVTIQLFGCLWFTRRLRLIREEVNNENHAA